METIQYRITPAQSSEKVYIRVDKPTEDELGIITRQTGFVEVNPSKAEAVLEKLENGELGVRFSKTKNDQGLFDVTVIKAGEVEETEKSNGALVHN